MVNSHLTWICRQCSTAGRPAYPDVQVSLKMTPKHENFPSGLEAFFLIVFLMGIELVIGTIAMALQSFLGVKPGDIAGVIAVLANAVLFTVLLHYKQLSYRELFHSSASKFGATIFTLVLPLLLILPGLELAMNMLGALVEAWLPLSAGQERMFDDMMGNGVISFVTACLIAPVLEEMLFRGIILRSFLYQYSRSTAIWGSSVLFGLAHLNIYQFAVATATGLVCGWLYEKTRSLWPGIFLHAGANAIVLCSYQFMSSNGKQGSWELSDAVLLLILVLAGVGISLLHRVVRLADTSVN